MSEAKDAGEPTLPTLVRYVGGKQSSHVLIGYEKPLVRSARESGCPGKCRKLCPIRVVTDQAASPHFCFGLTGVPSDATCRRLNPIPTPGLKTVERDKVHLANPESKPANSVHSLM